MQTGEIQGGGGLPPEGTPISEKEWLAILAGLKPEDFEDDLDPQGAFYEYDMLDPGDGGGGGGWGGYYESPGGWNEEVSDIYSQVQSLWWEDPNILALEFADIHEDDSQDAYYDSLSSYEYAHIYNTYSYRYDYDGHYYYYGGGGGGGGGGGWNTHLHGLPGGEIPTPGFDVLV